MRFEGSSLIPPDAPVPPPPWANVFPALPVYLVGTVFAFSLACLLVFEVRDRFFPENDETADEHFETPEPFPPVVAHVHTDDATRCAVCHEMPLHHSKNELKTASGAAIPLEDLPPEMEWELIFRHLEGMGGNPFVSSGTSSLSGRPDVGAFRGHDACIACHSYEEIDLNHGGHFFQPIRQCTSCHDLHDPNMLQDSLLAYPRSHLCSRCHDSPW